MDEHILVVDDEADIKDSVHEFLQKSGYNSLTASTAEEALELLKSNRVSVIITDIILPGKDGLVHISQISDERVETISDFLTEGQMVKVKVLDVDNRGRIKLSMKEITQ